MNIYGFWSGSSLVCLMLPIQVRRGVFHSLEAAQEPDMIVLEQDEYERPIIR